ncbi:acyl carrier protein [Streptomyces sp. V2]|uniref:Acyl carrier protein n=1 Tax=Streptomyces niveiscabiei TaxID=164115 RepID=A0ABW9HZG5_9ACTN|nr:MULTISPECIES: acyl carrier protein [Streptomyces]PWG08475.1 acyl carrier protein [Streptomyces sp. V2]QZZ27664.1 acyl carrier protein [Streptomyces sp. ST1015]
MDLKSEIYATIAAELEIDAGGLSDDQHFRSLPNFDSMRVLQIIVRTERAYDIEIDDEATFKTQTIGDFITLVDGLRRQREAV